jgi:hypothetical protein
MEKNISNITELRFDLATFGQIIFNSLQHDFRKLNHQIPGEFPLESFRNEYSKLFGRFQKSMLNQFRFIEKAEHRKMKLCLVVQGYVQ